MNGIRTFFIVAAVMKKVVNMYFRVNAKGLQFDMKVVTYGVGFWGITACFAKSVVVKSYKIGRR